MILLSILIPTIPEREKQFKAITAKLINQAFLCGSKDEVEFVFNSKPKGTISIGLKRDEMYKKAKGLFAVQIDDDDDVPDYFVETILRTIKNNSSVDCIGYYERCLINGVKKRSKISVLSKEWRENKIPINGVDYLRTPFFKTPIKTELCQKTGVLDMRFGEDHDFAKRIFPLLKSESFINKVMYFYTANSLTQQQHKERYGITE